jgi:hypothetical protein
MHPDVSTPGPQHQLDHLEIVLEETAGDSWWHSLLCTVTSRSGTGYAHFVAAVPGDDGDRPAYRVTSAPFPRLRSVPADVPAEEAWTPGMAAVLDDLRHELERDGWVPAGRSSTPWSHRYVRSAGRDD